MSIIGKRFLGQLRVRSKAWASIDYGQSKGESAGNDCTALECHQRLT